MPSLDCLKKACKQELRRIPFLLLAFGACQMQTFAADTHLLKGKVIDAEGQPVSGVKIVIHNEDSEQEINGKSDGKGNFEIEHPQCITLSFDVYPSDKSGLTAAHYANVSGELTKHFIVRLHKGFRVTGRILAEGKGVKGLEVRAYGQDGSSSATVHGGGVARTRGNGEYSLLLTPGKKTFHIKNDIYANLSPIYEHEFTITGDTRLPDMTLPLTK